jgi:hypothetical protein
VGGCDRTPGRVTGFLDWAGVSQELSKAGLTFPGMFEEPGCSAGNSARRSPCAGPRVELETLAAERVRAEDSRAQAEAAREQLRDAEGFLEELSRRLHGLTREEMAAIVRRAVPRVTVSPRGDGRKVTRAA